METDVKSVQITDNLLPGSSLDHPMRAAILLSKIHCAHALLSRSRCRLGNQRIAMGKPPIYLLPGKNGDPHWLAKVPILRDDMFPKSTNIGKTMKNSLF